jgi:tRNA pseudouridine55 synthase
MNPTSWHGLLVLDKPAGLTSREAVDRAQRWFPRSARLGHTGTLDPLATGVLVLCVGAATRLTEYVQDMAKTYRAGLRLGARSDTDDADGTVTPLPVDRPPERAAVARQLQAFVGEIDQVPPAYSAAKVTGRRAYDLARQGEEVSLQPRRVRISGIDLVDYDFPRLTLDVYCGKGTYIRSLARDLGERLGCGALVETLRRTRVGPFSVADALTLDADAATARSRLLPLSAAVADLPRLTVNAQEAGALRQGRGLPLHKLGLPEAARKGTAPTAVFLAGGGLVAVARGDAAKGLLRPEKVLPEPARGAPPGEGACSPPAGS